MAEENGGWHRGARRRAASTVPRPGSPTNAGNGVRRASRRTPAAMWRAARADLTGGRSFFFLSVDHQRRCGKQPEQSTPAAGVGGVGEVGRRSVLDLVSSLDKVMLRALRFVLPDVKRWGWSHVCVRMTWSYQIFFRHVHPCIMHVCRGAKSKE